MKRYSHGIFLIRLFFIFSQLLLAARADAQESKIDDVAKKLAKQIAKAKIKSVVLENFAAPDGSPSPQGKLLTAMLFNHWVSHQQSFFVLQSDRLEDFLSQNKLTARDLDTPGTLQQAGNTLNIEALISGTLAPGPSQFVLNIVVRRTENGESLGTVSKTFPRSGIFAGFDVPPSDGSPPDVYRAGLNGVGTPTCAYCPQPDYTNKARAEKIAGTVLMDVVVTAEGRVANIVVLKSPDAGLAEKAIGAVKSWRFKPAKSAAGNPVAVRVQVEITFHLY